MPKVGKKFYRVHYDGRMEQLTVKKIENGKPTFSLFRLTSVTDFNHVFLDDPVDVGDTMSFPFSLIEEKPKEFFEDLQAAKEMSLSNFKKIINPDSKYKVARYFDDVFEAVITDAMTKKEARAQAKKYNAQPSYYVSYGILAIGT